MHHVLEPPPGYVITWYTQFNGQGRHYQYAALHVAGKGWYLTGRDQTPLSWAQLLGRIRNAPCWVLTTGTQLSGGGA